MWVNVITICLGRSYDFIASGGYLRRYCTCRIELPAKFIIHCYIRDWRRRRDAASTLAAGEIDFRERSRSRRTCEAHFQETARCAGYAQYRVFDAFSAHVARCPSRGGGETTFFLNEHVDV